MPKKLSHYDGAGRARMVDVSGKGVSRRQAEASAFVAMKPAVIEALPKNPKGDPLEVARIAGIMAAKRTAELIPLCHQLPLDSVQLEFAFPDDERVEIRATARATARTGVEMEAFVAVSVAALTIYDMCKAIDRGMVISEIRLDEKRGGKSGIWQRELPGARGPAGTR